MISSKLRHAWRWNRPGECYLIGDLWTLIEEDWHVWIWAEWSDGGRRAGRQRKSQTDSGGREREAEMRLIKSTIGRVGQWQGKGTGVTDMNRQMYVGRQTLRQTVMELFGSFLRQTYWALYFPDAQYWPSFVGCDFHCRAKKQNRLRSWLSHSVIRQVPL